MTALHTLLKNMKQVETELSQFELKFGVNSKEFYRAMTNGDLEEFDELDDYRMEFVRWLGLYETWLSLNEKYRQLIQRQPVALQIKVNLEPVYA
jgi:hypothetical protein